MRRLAALLLLAACRSQAPQSPPATPAPAAAPEPPPLAVTGIELGRVTGDDGEGRERGTVFGPRDVLYVKVDLDGTAPKAQVTARWLHDGKVLHEEPQVVPLDQGLFAAEFHVMKASGWEPGAYRVDVLLDGLPAGSRQFEVHDAPAAALPAR
jgi:hypothetical protein